MTKLSNYKLGSPTRGFSKHIIILYSNNNKTLHWVDNFCCLGYNMSSSFKYYDHSEIDKRCHAMQARANMLGSRCSKVSDEVKKLMFKTYFSSIYCNCSSLWIPQTQKCFKKIRVAFHDGFRLIFKI